ncbi:uncharacterized protein J8A68_002275 [[Candida] subhashii]|uniref:Uncharacterized protein n=1 Tax=[Candida] subhashii TaxID=561895 RepID=A0A8J5QJG2_9ASCO|nr:uncharacterized protein J8A68_002275 [[Candida] subhashii]KAG7664212.1 hypothetical protein J8A68_002275 [[Candida] subhashii]
MTELSINDTVRLNKLHTNPKRGHRLGTASATWKKIKSATSGVANYQSTPSNGTNGSASNSDEETTEIDVEAIIENGPSGELLILFPNERKLEIWDWSSPSNDCSSDGDTLFLQNQININLEITTEINVFKLYQKSQDEYHVLIICTDGIDYFLQSHSFTIHNSVSKANSSCMLNKFNQDTLEFTIKSSSKFICVGNNQGFLSLFEFNQETKEIIPANDGMKLANIWKRSCNPIISNPSFQGKVSDNELMLRTSVNGDSVPIFDIVDNWLVYSPTKFEYRHLKASNDSSITRKEIPQSSFDPIVSNYSSNGETAKLKNSMFTPMKLPMSKPLLAKVFSSLSNTALDGLFKLSEVSSAKFKAYMGNNTNSSNKNVEPASINSISKSIGKLLYSTASTTATSLQNSTKNLKPNNNQILCILDLGNDKVMGTFKPPGGVSQVSLSPYDLQLVHANARGDSLYMWDLYRLPVEIEVIGKFIRGKTSGIIEEIFWFVNNYDSKQNEGDIFGSNSGFGVITKSTGSVHWYNINYLSGSLNNNHPNSFRKKTTKQTTAVAPGKFMDSWILSSFKAKQFAAIPSDLRKENLNQLAIIDNNNYLKLISPLNGQHFYRFELPNCPVSSSCVPLLDEDIQMNGDYDLFQQPPGSKSVTPLSQAEIQTCSPFLNLINNNRIEFALLEQDYETFGNEFGNQIPETIIKFSENEQPNYNSIKSKEVLKLKESDLPSFGKLYIDQDEESDDCKD